MANKVISSAADLQGATIQLAIKDVRSVMPGARFVTGQPNSSVAVLEFADFECPPCRMQYKEIENAVLGSQGKASLFLQSFPLAMHRHAKDLSLIALALKDDEFRKFSDLAYSLDGPALDQLIVDYQTKLTLKKSPWRNRSLADLAKVQRSALNAGVTGTPTVLVINFPKNQVWRCLGVAALNKVLQEQ